MGIDRNVLSEPAYHVDYHNRSRCPVGLRLVDLWRLWNPRNHSSDVGGQSEIGVDHHRARPAKTPKQIQSSESLKKKHLSSYAQF